MAEKKTKIIKADFRNIKPSDIVNTPPPPPIPDLVIQFASNKKVYTVTVPVEEMDRVAKAFGSILQEHGIYFRIEEKLR